MEKVKQIQKNGKQTKNEVTQRLQSDITTYQASPEQAKELTERLEKKRIEMEKERDRQHALAGSKGKKRFRKL